MDTPAKFAKVAAIACTAVVGTIAAVAALPALHRAGYCQALGQQHVQHRNAVAAMGRQLDRQTAGFNFGYEQSTVALSDAMYGSLRRDNGCN